MPDGSHLSIYDVVDRIVEENERIRSFWSSADGWAPVAAAKLLSKSRLDWQVSLSHCLRLWIRPFTKEEDYGRLILGYANLGSLAEGTMKLFLSVFYEDYVSDSDAIKKKGKLQDPDSLKLENLRQLYQKKKIWNKSWDTWINRIQWRRNAIHAYKDRDVGTQKELLEDIRKYLDLLKYMNARLPYPDPTESDF